MRSAIFILLVVAGCLTFPAVAHAAAPPYVPVQGVLTDAAGIPLDGDVNVTFSIYDAEMGGAAIWTETQAVRVSAGLFTTYLGQVNSLDLALFRDYGDLWLGIQVEADPEMARIRLGSAPFSGYAEHTRAAGVPAGMIAMFNGGCPSGWSYLATFEGRFVRGASSYGATGGGQSHTHADDLAAPAHTHSFSDTVSQSTGSDGTHSHTVSNHTHGAGGYSAANHTHDVNIGSFSSGSFPGSGNWNWWPSSGNPISAGHSHDVDPPNTTSTGSGGLGVSGQSGGASPGTDNAGSHSHSLADNTCSGTTGGASATALTGGISAADHTPPYIEVVFCVKN